MEMDEITVVSQEKPLRPLLAAVKTTSDRRESIGR